MTTKMLMCSNYEQLKEMKQTKAIPFVFLSIYKSSYLELIQTKLYFIMQLGEGGELFTKITNNGSYSQSVHSCSQTINISRQVSRGQGSRNILPGVQWRQLHAPARHDPQGHQGGERLLHEQEPRSSRGLWFCQAVGHHGTTSHNILWITSVCCSGTFCGRN